MNEDVVDLFEPISYVNHPPEIGLYKTVIMAITHEVKILKLINRSVSVYEMEPIEIKIHNENRMNFFYKPRSKLEWVEYKTGDKYSLDAVIGIYKEKNEKLEKKVNHV